MGATGGSLPIDIYNFPKVHTDSRRTIYANDTILKDKKEISIIFLNKGKAIGGCKHKNREYFAILQGKVYVLGSQPWDGVFIEGEGARFEEESPHSFEAMEDSIIMEWGITAEEKKDSPKDSDMLKEINSINDPQ